MMTANQIFITTLTLIISSIGQARVGDDAIPLALATVHFEQNATDGDVEVVFEVKGGDEGLVILTVVSPDGRRVVDFTAPDASTLGLRQFRFESPEPKDVKSLKSAYPEGRYKFTAATASGNSLYGESTLSHQLPATTSFIHPKTDAEGVTATNLEIAWAPVENVAAYIIYIEQDELDVSVAARLPESAAVFSVPHEFLRSGTEYQLGIGTVASNGNVSFVETTFLTVETQ
jgi:hypothetical protein